MKLVNLVLALLNVEPLVLALLDGLADWGYGVSSVESRIHDLLLDGHYTFGKLGPQLTIGLLQGECSVKLFLRCLLGWAAMAIGCADYGIV